MSKKQCKDIYQNMNQCKNTEEEFQGAVERNSKPMEHRIKAQSMVS